MSLVAAPLRLEAAIIQIAMCELDTCADKTQTPKALWLDDLAGRLGLAVTAFSNATDRFLSAIEKYNADEPRVPAGNAHESGEWTRDGEGVGQNSRVRPQETAPRNGNVQVAASDRERPAWLGRAPNDQHGAGVKQAIQDELARGYKIYSSTLLGVNVPGFVTPRIYDFIAINPKTGSLIGVEVKTTKFETISLDLAQVTKDVALMQSGGAPLSVGGGFVKGIDYIVTCKECESIDVRSALLRTALKRANVNFLYSRFRN